MSSTFTLRLPRQLKEKMRRHKCPWSEELRTYIEQRINTLELAEAEEIDARLEKLATALDRINLDNATTGIREDRDHR